MHPAGVHRGLDLQDFGKLGNRLAAVLDRDGVRAMEGWDVRDREGPLCSFLDVHLSLCPGL